MDASELRKLLVIERRDTVDNCITVLTMAASGPLREGIEEAIRHLEKFQAYLAESEATSEADSP